MKGKTRKSKGNDFDSKKAIAPIISMVLLLGFAVGWALVLCCCRLLNWNRNNN